MTKEASLWKWLSNARDQRSVDMDRVENYLVAGMPDVEGHLYMGAQFWIELKSAQKIPRKATTPVRFKTRHAQVVWLERRWKMGGLAWMLLQVGGERFLLPGSYAGEVHKGMSLEQLRAACWKHPKATAGEMIDMAGNPARYRYATKETRTFPADSLGTDPVPLVTTSA